MNFFQEIATEIVSIIRIFGSGLTEISVEVSSRPIPPTLGMPLPFAS